MKKGSELKRVSEAAIKAGVADMPTILKFLRSFPDEPEARGVEVIPPEHREWLRDSTKGDIFRSEKEMLAAIQMMGFLFMKYASEHPDEFDLEKLYSEMDSNMEAEGWL